MSSIEHSTTYTHELLELIAWKREYDEKKEQERHQEHLLHVQHYHEMLKDRDQIYIAREIKRIREQIHVELEAITHILNHLRQEMASIPPAKRIGIQRSAPSIIHRILTYVETACKRIDTARTWLAIHRRRMSTLKRSITH